jgi:type VI secretion system protein ImpM
VSEQHPTAPGWYGKLPSVGDFASRRWPEGLLEAWDHWLAQELNELRQQDPDGWLQGYLDSPTWRFVLAPGVLGPTQAWPLAGVLMPSVDKVGRYFPLSLVSPLNRLPHTVDEAQALFNWLHGLDDLAADVLQEDWSIEQLETDLAQRQAPHWPTPPNALLTHLQSLSSGQASLVPLALPEPRVAMAAALGQGLLAWATLSAPDGALGRHLHPGLSWWWAEPAAAPESRQVWLGKGLPSGHDFAVLLGHHNSPQDLQPSLGSPHAMGDTAPSNHHAA